MAKNKKETFVFNGTSVSLDALEGHRNVFISYKRENVSFVARLVHELERHHISVWFDINELHQYVGAEYTNRIHRGIDDSDFFLLIYTNTGENDIECSDFIINEELGYATSRGKTILFYPQVPIDLSKSRLRPYVEKIQWLDTDATAAFQADTQESALDEKKLALLSAKINREGEFSMFDDQALFLIRIALQRKLNKVTVFGNYTKICGASMNGFYDPEEFVLKVVNRQFVIPIPGRFRPMLEQLGFLTRDKTRQIEKLLERLQPDTSSIRRTLVEFLHTNSKVYTTERLHSWLVELTGSPIFQEVRLVEKEELTPDTFIDIVAQMTAVSFIHNIRDKRILQFNGSELGVYSMIDNRTGDSEHRIVGMELYYSDYFTFKCMTEMYHILCSIDSTPFNTVATGNMVSLAPFLCSLGLGGFITAVLPEQIALMWTRRSGNISSGDMWHFSYDETVNVLLDSVKDSEGNICVGEDDSIRIDIPQIIQRALREEIGASRSMVDMEHTGFFEVGLIQSERLEVELISQAVLRLPPEPSLEEQIQEMHDRSCDGYLEISKIQFLPLYNRSRLIGRLLSPESYAIFTRMQERVRKIAEGAIIGEGTIVEEGSYISPSAVIGCMCKIHRNVYIDQNVRIGDFVKIQNNNSIYEGVTLDDGVFVGTNVSFINDMYPRAIRRDGLPVTREDWTLQKTFVGYGASIGAGAVIRCGVTIGEWAMVGCGAVVLEDVPAGATVVGNPARIIRTKQQ